MATFIPNVTDKFADPALYTPNFGFLDTMLRRRQSMYDAGFAQVNAQNSVLNRNLTHADNQVARDQFVRSAQDQLKNLSSLDLSQQQNVQNALQVYQPFYKNTRILGDMSLTAHYDQQEAIAEGLRLKDGGKEFSQANLDYVRMQREDFKNDSADSVGYYLSNKRSFTPYRDYKKKYLEAYEKFKPDVADVEYEDGQYIRGERNASVHAFKFKKFLESVLDEQDLKQIEIEGVVKYGRSNEALVAGYAEKAQKDAQIIDGQVAYLQNQLKIASTPDEKKALNDQIKSYTDNKEQIAANLNAMMSADPAAIKQIRDNVAKELHYDNVVSQFAEAAERKDVKKTVQVNGAWVAIYNQSQQNARQKDQQQFDIYKMEYAETIKQRSQGMNGALSGNYSTLNSPDAETYTAASLEKDLTEAQQGIQAATTTISSHLHATGKPSDAASVKAFIQKFSQLQNDMVPLMDQSGNVTGYKSRTTGQPVDPRLLADFQKWQQYTAATAPMNMTITNLQGLKNQLNERVKQEAKGEYDQINAAVNNILPGRTMTITTTTGKKISLSSKDIYEGLSSGAITYGDETVRTGYGDATSASSKIVLTVGGERIEITPQMNQVVSSVMSRIQNVRNSAPSKKIQQIRNNMFNSEIITNGKLATFKTDSDLYKNTVGELTQQIGKDVVLRGVDPLTGRVAFSLKEKDNSKPEDIIDKTGGRGRVTYDETNELYYVSGLKGMNVLDQMSGMERAMYKAASTPVKGKQIEKGMYSFDSAPFKIGNLPYDFYYRRILKETPGVNGTKDINYEYYLYDGSNSGQPLLPPVNDALQLIQQTRELSGSPLQAAKLVESLK